jgi:hypothetical protein
VGSNLLVWPLVKDLILWHGPHPRSTIRPQDLSNYFESMLLPFGIFTKWFISVSQTTKQGCPFCEMFHLFCILVFRETSQMKHFVKW